LAVSALVLLSGVLSSCGTDDPVGGRATTSTVDEFVKLAKKCESVDQSVRGSENRYSAQRVDEAGLYDPLGSRLECHFDIHGDPNEAYTCPDGSTIYGPLRTLTAYVTLDGHVDRIDPVVVVPEACSSSALGGPDGSTSSTG
jgi:hypothetical protein